MLPCIILFVVTILDYATVFAWGDNIEGGRPSYTIDEINKGAIGATFESDGEDYKNSENYPGQIIFNTISDSVIGNEKNYVSARECTVSGGGGATKDTIWNANEIEVEDGKTYIIRMYVHNNNPNGRDAVAEDTKVSFNIPTVSSREIKINGYINSSNASPSEYVDDVIFISDQAFHFEYIYGSALLENNKVGLGGIKLDDAIVNAKTGGVLIGYDALDGRVPGGYEYDNFVTIQVKVVYDNEFYTEVKARLADSEDKTWYNTINAKVGDKVEFQIQYENKSNESHRNVMIRDVLPKSLKYVDDTTKIFNTKYPDGAQVVENTIATNGLNIGHYAAGANAYIRFTAEVIDNGLACGPNTLVNWAQGQAGAEKQIILQDYATVSVHIAPKNRLAEIIFLIVLMLLLLLLIIKLLLKVKSLKK